MKIQGRNERSQDHTNATISTGVVTDDISLNDDKNLRGHKRPISHKAYLCARANSKLSTMETWLTLRLNPQHECISILQKQRRAIGLPGLIILASRWYTRGETGKKPLILLPSTLSAEHKPLFHCSWMAEREVCVCLNIAGAAFLLCLDEGTLIEMREQKGPVEWHNKEWQFNRWRFDWRLSWYVRVMTFKLRVISVPLWPFTSARWGNCCFQ